MSEDPTVNHATKQQQMLEHIQRAKQRGQSLAQYAKAQGLNKKALYNYHWLLKKKGLLAQSTDTPSFVKVTTTGKHPASLGMRCRIVFPNGIHVELSDFADNLPALLHQVQSL